MSTPKLIHVDNIEGIESLISAGSGGTSSYIDSGRKFDMPDGFNLPISKGTEYISGKGINRYTNSITLNPRTAALIIDKADGTTDKLESADPISFVDNNTVGLWKPNGDTTCPNLATGISSIAVANDLAKTGTITKVDGRDGGYAGNFGSTGYYKGTNTTNFPSGAAEREVVSCFTVNKINTSTPTIIHAYGAHANYQKFVLYITTNGHLWCSIYGSGYDRDTSFVMESGKTYVISYSNDGIITKIFVNGALIYSVSEVPSTVLTNSLYIGADIYSTTANAYLTYHFIELRNKCRSAQQIAEIATKLLFPVCYDKINAAYPTIKDSDKALAYHEYKFDETSGTAVADTAGTLNGTATGTTIVNSELCLGKSRKFNGSESISLGNMSFTSQFTVISIVNITSYTGDTNVRSIIGNYNGSTGQQIGIGNGGTLVFVDGSVRAETDTGLIQPGNQAFVAVTVNSSDTSLYVGNNQPIKKTFSFTPSANTMLIGKGGTGSTSYMNGVIDYLLYIPRAMAQIEIAEIYDSFMNKGRKSIKSILPANSISLGYVETDSNEIISINDADWAYGRREYITGGNRIVTMDYKSVVAQSPASMQWQSPFGAGTKYRTDWYSAENTSGMNDYQAVQYEGANGIGVLTTQYKNGKVGSYVCSTGSTYANSAWRAGGYIRPIFTLLEDESV